MKTKVLIRIESFSKIISHPDHYLSLFLHNALAEKDSYEISMPERIMIFLNQDKFSTVESISEWVDDFLYSHLNEELELMFMSSDFEDELNRIYKIES